MFKKFLFLFFLVLLAFSSSFAQDEEKFFVAIKLNEINKELNKFDLPVYHQTKEALLTEVDKTVLKRIQEEDFNVEILDKAENAEEYLIFDKRKYPLEKNLLKEKVFELDDFYIIKKSETDKLSGNFMKVEINKSAFVYKSENKNFVTPLTATSSESIEEVLNEISADSVRYFIQSLQNFGTRHWDNGNRKEVALWIKNQFIKFGIASARLDSFEFRGTWQYNVVAEIAGSSGSGEAIVIGAHHDSITNDQFSNGDAPAPGADDNASGTSAVLEIARSIMRAGYHPEKSLVFQTYAAEEMGLHGSKYLAAKARETGERIKLMINHDMISYNSRVLNQSYVSINYYNDSEAFREMAIGNTQNFTPLTPVVGQLNSASSDSYSFAREGFRSVYFEEYDFSPWYHSTSDVVSNYDMDYCAEVIKASAATVITASEFPSAVQNYFVYDLGTGNSLLLEWDKSPEFDLDKYKISFGKSSGVYDQFFYTTDTTFILDDLNESEKYFIGISVIDKDENESPVIEKNLIPYSNPLTPANSEAEADWMKVNLSWNSNKEVDIAGYNIYRSENDTLDFELLNRTIIVDTSFADETINSGSYYYYYISGIDKDGNESLKNKYLRSRAVTLDKGIVLIDETEDGDGTELKPTDETVDSAYKNLLSGFAYDEIDTKENGGINLADLGPYKTILWQGDDNSDFDFPNLAIEDIKKYLNFGGNFIYSGFKPSKAFANNTSMTNIFAPEDFIRKFLKIESAENNLFARFNGALGSGYTNMLVDTSKTSFSLNYHLRGIESIAPVENAEVIFRFNSNYDSTSNFAKLQNQPVGVLYSGEDYKSVVLSFPLYYMEEISAKTFLESLLTEFGEVVSVKNPSNKIIPDEFSLAQNYPNPFNPSTTIRFSIPENSFVTLKIYDILGREAAVLINENLNAGVYSKIFSPAKELSSGVYLYQLRADDFTSTKKLMLLK